jgi:hypothetical protein
MWRPRELAAAFVLTAAVVGAHGSAHADVSRFALVVGANRGAPEEVELRYAVDDATRIARILRVVGGFPSENVLEIEQPDPDSLRHALSSLAERMHQERGETLLFVFYSGHADAEALHLGRFAFRIAELAQLLERSSATARVLVLDACRSGALTRVKGGRPGPSFAIQLETPLGAEGLAMITSSAAAEDSQESDALHASFFTHYFASALQGAADRNQDGEVSLTEAFTYASEQTLAATADTLAGPQHATYRLDLRGRDDLILTRPGKDNAVWGTLELAKAGWYIVERDDGRVVAEVHAAGSGRRLVLQPGRYRIVAREPEYRLESDLTLGAGDHAVVTPEHMRQAPYARIVRKGGASIGSERSASRKATIGRFQLGLSVMGYQVGFNTLSTGGVRYQLELSGRLYRHGDFSLLLGAAIAYVGTEACGAYSHLCAADANFSLFVSLLFNYFNVPLVPSVRIGPSLDLVGSQTQGQAIGGRTVFALAYWFIRYLGAELQTGTTLAHIDLISPTAPARTGLFATWDVGVALRGNF